MKFGVCLAVGLALASGVEAGGVDQLKGFLKSTQSGRAAFTQSIASKPPRKPIEASGSFEFARPGKFRWVYEKPYYQLLVADGDKLWVHDRDLNQVTVKKLGAALGASPAAILAGENALEKNFTLKDDGQREGLEWVLATPRGESTFEWVKIGFAGERLAAMELKDSFGQTTTIRFTQFERNPALDASRFRFTPPQGADVVGE
ncbi:MAG: hypothetical protein RIR70_75 [Pseudomonadota bacterium]|jgi:outer membrane lipoprotein carrier protein